MVLCYTGGQFLLVGCVTGMASSYCVCVCVCYRGLLSDAWIGYLLHVPELQTSGDIESYQVHLTLPSSPDPDLQTSGDVRSYQVHLT